MVRSKLNPDLNYREYKQLERDDADYDASMYEIELLGKEVRIAIGRGKTDKKDIIYYPGIFGPRWPGCLWSDCT